MKAIRVEQARDLVAEEQLTVAIVDDEPLSRDCVRLALMEEPGVRVVAECADGEAAVRAILEQSPDLVFLDVQMPGMSGFDVIQQVGADRMPPVVFVTAYDRYALRAFEVHALDYLLKPFSDDRFREAFRRARRWLGLQRDGELGQRLAALLDDYGLASRAAPAVRRGYATRLLVRKGERIQFVRPEEVDWFEAADNYVRLHVGTTSYLIRATLSGLMEKLNPVRFVRIHRRVIVNLDRVKEIQPWFRGDYVVILLDGRQLRVGRAFRDRLLRPVR
ncbi:MAG: DNA-binding response regulator [Gemmatimonadales bacterium]|nr:Sensory transduction protein LytR [bacterium HR33]GIW53293.1 MAG: DNA-binding response regulator [Gemmatimonadales bacterium]